MADPKDLASQLSAFNAIEAGEPWYKKQLPMEGRATFLPFRDTMEGSVFNKRELALPGILAGALNAFTAPERARTNTDPTFNAGEEAANFALNTFGGGIATGKALRNPTGQGGVDLSMNAWHGSPHHIEGKFDLAKVGTGEGNQSYGHGIYVGEARGTGETYRNNLSDFTWSVDGKPYDANNAAHRAAIELKISGGNINKNEVIDRYERNIADLESRGADWANTSALQKKQELEVIKTGVLPNVKETSLGNLYKVDLPDEQLPFYIDYDRPIKDQPQVYELIKQGITDPDIRRTFESNAESGITGANAYSNYLSGKTDAERSANAVKLGIMGMKYFDEFSRNLANWEVSKSKDGKFLLKNHDMSSSQWKEFPTREEAQKALEYQQSFGTRNFVSFKPETLKILEKNDVPVTRKELLEQEFDKLDK
jgi:hypothetical protein